MRQSLFQRTRNVLREKWFSHVVYPVYGSCIYPVQERLMRLANPLNRSRLEAATPGPAVPILQALRTDGIAVLPGFFQGEFLRQVQATFNHLVEVVRQSPPAAKRSMPWPWTPWKDAEYGHMVGDSYTTYSLDPFKYGLPLLQVGLNEVFLAVVHRYLGRAGMLGFGVASRYYPMPPRDFGSFQWHHDGLGKRINIMTLLTDVTDKDQAMTYLKGTQNLYHGYSIQNGRSRWTEEQVKALPRVDPVQCTGPAGTVFIFDSNGIHRGNRGLGAVRDAVICSYNLGHGHSRFVIPTTFYEALSPMQRAYLARNPDIDLV